MIPAARQLKEKCAEQHRDLYTIVHTVNWDHEKIWLRRRVHCNPPPVPQRKDYQIPCRRQSI